MPGKIDRAAEAVGDAVGTAEAAAAAAGSKVRRGLSDAADGSLRLRRQRNASKNKRVLQKGSRQEGQEHQEDNQEAGDSRQGQGTGAKKAAKKRVSVAKKVGAKKVNLVQRKATGAKKTAKKQATVAKKRATVAKKAGAKKATGAKKTVKKRATTAKKDRQEADHGCKEGCQEAELTHFAVSGHPARLGQRPTEAWRSTITRPLIGARSRTDAFGAAWRQPPLRLDQSPQSQTGSSPAPVGMLPTMEGSPGLGTGPETTTRAGDSKTRAGDSKSGRKPSGSPLLWSRAARTTRRQIA